MKGGEGARFGAPASDADLSSTLVDANDAVCAVDGGRRAMTASVGVGYVQQGRVPVRLCRPGSSDGVRPAVCSARRRSGALGLRRGWNGNQE